MACYFFIFPDYSPPHYLVRFISKENVSTGSKTHNKWLGSFLLVIVSVIKYY